MENPRANYPANALTQLIFNPTLYFFPIPPFLIIAPVIDNSYPFM